MPPPSPPPLIDQATHAEQQNHIKVSGKNKIIKNLFNHFSKLTTMHHGRKHSNSPLRV